MRHYLSTRNAGLPENQRSYFYMHTRHSKHINETIYQTPLSEAEVFAVGAPGYALPSDALSLKPPVIAIEEHSPESTEEKFFKFIDG